jgi:hypothetical protein
MKETLGFMAFILIPAGLAFLSDFLRNYMARNAPQAEAAPAAAAASRTDRPRRADAASSVVSAAAPIAAVGEPVESPAQRATRKLIESEQQYHLDLQTRQRQEEPAVVFAAEEFVANSLSPADLRDFDYADFRTQEQHH